MPEIEPEDWLTYAEAGRLLGKTPEAVRALARRQHWPRQTPNLPGGHARARLPEITGLDRARSAVTVERLTEGQMTTQPNGSDRVSDDVVRVFDRALEALQQQLDRAERRKDEQKETIRHLRSLLADERRRLMAAQPELRGKDLACWCAPEPCHGDVLFELANA